MSKNKFVSQQERMANIHPNIKKSLEEIEKEKYEKAEYQYFEENDKLQDWDEYEATLNKEEITELIIKPKHFKFLNNKLVIKDYPNLKTLYACGIGIDKIELDCSSLENLYLTGNILKQVDLSKVSNLVNLMVNSNKLTDIDVRKLKKLEDLRCNHNNLQSLDVNNLKCLKTLDCSNNSFFKQWLTLGSNPSLWSLDVAENFVPKFKLPFLPKLEMLSVRHVNSIGQKKTLTLSSPKLKFLDYHKSCISQVVFDKKHPLEDPDQLQICNDESYRNADGTYNPDVATDWEGRFYRMKQQREKEFIDGEWGFAFEDNPNKNKKTTDDEGYESDDNTINASNYKIPEKKDEIVDLNLSQWKLTGKLVIDGWANLKFLNVGDNRLQALVIKNCPNLKWLIYSHNAMPKEAEIDFTTCPNLTRIDNYRYDEFVDSVEEPEEDYQPTEDDLAQQKQALNEQVRLLLQRHEQGENIELAELMPYLAKLKLINSEYQVPLVMLYHTKQQQLTQNNQVLSLLAQVSKPEKLSLDQLAKLLTQLATYSRTSAYHENRTLIKELTRYLQDNQATSSLTALTPAPANYFTIPYLVILIITLTMIGIVISWCRKGKKNKYV